MVIIIGIHIMANHRHNMMVNFNRWNNKLKAILIQLRLQQVILRLTPSWFFVI